MAKAEFILKLIKAHLENNDSKFRRTVLQIAAKEASSGHNIIAKSMRELIDNFTPNIGQYAEHKPVFLNSNNGKTNLENLLHSSYPKERLTDMVLSLETKKRIRRIILEWRNYGLLDSHGLSSRKKILLVGPPGCGKTMASSVIASELGLPHFIVKLEGLISQYLGETTVHLKYIFDAMNLNQGIYLFDEFDVIGNNRNDKSDIGEIRRVLSSFLIYMEKHNSNSILIATTNNEKSLDNALFRRFDDIIYFSKPNTKQIEKLLKLKLKNINCTEINWNSVANKAKNMSFAEITKAIFEAIKTMILEDYELLSEDLISESIENRKKITASQVFNGGI